MKYLIATLLALIPIAAFAAEPTLVDHAVSSGGYRAIDAISSIVLLLMLVAMCRNWRPVQKFTFPFMDTLKDLEEKAKNASADACVKALGQVSGCTVLGLLIAAGLILAL